MADQELLATVVQYQQGPCDWVPIVRQLGKLQRDTLRASLMDDGPERLGLLDNLLESVEQVHTELRRMQRQRIVDTARAVLPADQPPTEGDCSS